MIDIDMPDNCDECRFNTEYGFCKAMPDNFCGNTDDRKRPEWCPLKEQEVKSIVVRTNSYGTKFYFCPNCDRQFYDFYKKPVYCDQCGQAVKWE